VKRAGIDCEVRDMIAPYGCGHCLACRKQRAKVWAHRLMLEASTHVQTIFVTLTYNPENEPEGETLVPRDLTLFMKLYRQAIHPRKIRYFNVGEYGNKNGRPHYHLMIFNGCLEDLPIIEKCWKKGFCQVSWFTEARASYLCKYVVKGLGKKSELLAGRHPEFMRCSKMNGGIGKAAVEGMAKRIKESPHTDLLPRVDSLSYGKTRKPLGRYLTNFLEGLFPQAKTNRTIAYDQHLRDEIIPHLEAGPLYEDSLLKAFEGKRVRLSELNKFYKKGGQL